MGTFRDADIGAAGSGSTQCTATIPLTVQEGDEITVVSQRSSSSSQDHLISLSNGGTFTRVYPAAAGSAAVAGQQSVVVFRKTAVASDAGATVTCSSDGLAEGRWNVGVYACSGVQAAVDDVQFYDPESSGVSFVLPAATPQVGSTGGLALGVALGSVNGGGVGMTFTSASSTIRDQATHTGSTGQNPAMALSDRPFTGDAEVAQASMTSSSTASSRGGLTILYSDTSGGGSDTGSGTGTISVASTQTATAAGAIVSSGSDFSLQEGAAGQMNATSLDPDGVTPKAGHWEHVSGDFNLVTLLSSSTDPDATFTAPEI